MVTVVTGRRLTAQAFDRCQHASLELVVVIGVQQVMLTVVLVLHHRLHLPQALRKLATGRRTFIGAAIGIAAPIHVHLGQIVAAFPQAAIYRVLHPGAIRPGLGTKHSPTGLARRQFRGQSFTFQLLALTAHPGRQRVEIIRLIQRRHRLHGGIEQADQIGERIPKEPRHAQGHVHPRTVQQAHREDFKVIDPLAARGPHRTHAHQRHRLGDIVTAGAHGSRAPYRQAELAQVVAVILQMPLKNQAGRLETDTPGRGRRQVAHIHGKKVAPRGQHIQPSAARRATGASRHKAATEGIQQALHFRRAAGVQARCHLFQQRGKNAPCFIPQRSVRQLQGALQRLLDQLRGIQLQTLTGIASGAPKFIADRTQGRRLTRRPGLGQGAVQRVETQLESLGQRPQQARLCSAAVAPGDTQQRQQCVDAQAPGR